MLEEYGSYLWFLLLIPAFYLLVPLLVRATQRFPVEPEVQPLDLEELDRRLAGFVMSRTRELIDLGFGEPETAQMPDAVPNVSAYMTVLVNRPEGDMAMVSVLISQADESIQTAYVEFHTRFAGGETFNTMNSSELHGFTPSPGETRTQVPSVTDPEGLYRLHRFVVDRDGPNAQKSPYPPGGAIDYVVNESLAGSYRVQAEKGWLYRSGDEYRVTMYGAYRLTWGLLQPFKAVREWLMRRRERRALDEFRRAGA